MKQKDFNHHFVNCISSGDIQLSKFFLSQIKDGPKLSAYNALLIYQEDYEARLTEALKNTYRCIHSVIGDDEFHKMAIAYIKSTPSLSPDLDDYGDSLAIYLDTDPIGKEYPFLSELAEFEWCFREIFHLPEIEGLLAQDFMNLLQNENAKIQLVPSVSLLKYQFQITAIYELKDSDQQEETFDYQSPQYVLMYKKNYFVKTLAVTKNQMLLLEKLTGPISVSAIFLNPPAKISPSEIQQLFQFLATERLILSCQ